MKGNTIECQWRRDHLEPADITSKMAAPSSSLGAIECPHKGAFYWLKCLKCIKFIYNLMEKLLKGNSTFMGKKMANKKNL